MTTVTGYTAERMQAIENGTIVSGVIDGAGHLILTKFDGTTVDAGPAIGPVGPVGPAATFAGYKEPYLDAGNFAGNMNMDFAAWNMWSINPTGNVTIVPANLPPAGKVSPATLIIKNSTYTVSWPVGTKFNGGTPPVLSGETWLSIVAFPTFLVVGLALQGVS